MKQPNTPKKSGGDERLNRLESHVSHLERLCEELNQVVLEQGRAQARLQVQLKKLVLSVEAQEGERIRETNPRPPHYQ